MARLIAIKRGFVVGAGPGPETDLLDFCRGRDRTLVLNGAAYPVRGDHLVLPRGIAQSAALAVLGRFERAAEAHALAVERRRRFREL